ncbi:MAG: hypothetical protein ACI9DF_005021, partial [Verrucomicrobiales bacterium]
GECRRGSSSKSESLSEDCRYGFAWPIDLALEQIFNGKYFK